MRRVDERLREVLAEEVGKLKDPRVGFVTVTGVDTAPDLRTARVYFSVLGDDDERRTTGEALVHAAPHLQARIADRVRIKYTPQLDFEIDPAIERGLRMEEILHRLEEERSGTAGDHDEEEP